MNPINSHKNLNRRNFILLGGTAAAGFLLLNKYSWAQDKFPLPKPQNFGSKNAVLNEEEFFLFSKFLMRDTSLNESFSKKIYSFLQINKAEKPELSDLYHLYEYIRTHPSINSSLLREYLLKNHRALKVYSQVVESWYTGVLSIETSSMRFSYFDAYMFKIISGIAPIPGTCGGATNYWSKKPANV